MDPATGLPAGAVWTADPASGFALSPSMPKAVPTVPGSTSLFDPAAGLQLHRIAIRVPVSDSGSLFDPANGIIVNALPTSVATPVYDPAAGFTV